MLRCVSVSDRKAFALIFPPTFNFSLCAWTDFYMVYQLQRRSVAARGVISMATCTQSAHSRPFLKGRDRERGCDCVTWASVVGPLSIYGRGIKRENRFPRVLPRELNSPRFVLRGLRSAFNMWHFSGKQQALKCNAGQKFLGKWYIKNV